MLQRLSPVTLCCITTLKLEMLPWNTIAATGGGGGNGPGTGGGGPATGGGGGGTRCTQWLLVDALDAPLSDGVEPD